MLIFLESPLPFGTILAEGYLIMSWVNMKMQFMIYRNLYRKIVLTPKPGHILAILFSKPAIWIEQKSS